MTTYKAPPTQTHLVLNGGDTLNVEANGLAFDTLINQGAVLNVAAGGTDIGTTNNGGNEYVFGTSTDMTLNFGGLVFVEAGAITGTTINAGGTEYDQGGASIGTTINLGGSQYVQNGSTATNTTIDGAFAIQYVDGGTSIATTIKAGLQIVRNGGMANNTIILDGGVEHVQNGSTANNVIFAGSNSLLELDKPSGLTGTIIDWNVGGKIDFLNTMVTGINETGNTLTVTYGDHETASYSLAGKQANTEFKLQPDGNGGTDLILQLPEATNSSSAHLLSLSGGGIKAMTADAGLFAGLLQHFGASTTIGDLLSKVSAVSANSGSSWFTDLLAYSPDFEDSLQDYTHFFSENGYMGKLKTAYYNYANAPSGGINEVIVKILNAVGDVAGMHLAQLYGLLTNSSIDWNNFLTNVIFEPDNSAQLLKSVNFHSSHLDHSDQSYRTDAIPSQSLIFQSSISSNDAAINKSGSLFNEAVSTITNAGADSSNNTYIFIPAVITSLGSETDISAPALPSLSTGSLDVTYSTYDGSQSATTVLPNFNFDGLSAFLATSASSAAVSAVSSGGVYNTGGLNDLIITLFPDKIIRDIVVSGLLYDVQNVSPLVQVSNANGTSTASDPASGILNDNTTPDFLVTQGNSLLRLADGAYIDNTSVTSGLTYLQANHHLNNFIDTTLTYLDGVDLNLGKINPGYDNIGKQAAVLFTGSDQNQTESIVNLSHPSAAVFDSAKTTGLDKPIWEYIGSNHFKLDYFQLGVTTAKNDMGIAVGERGTLNLWVVTTNAGSLPSLDKDSWTQYSDLYQQMIDGLQFTNNGYTGAEFLASSLGLVSMGATVADVQLTGIAPHLDHAMI